MPIRQYDADRNIQEIKTLNDVTVQSPLPVNIPGTLTATDTVLQGRVGGTNSVPAPTPTTDTGLSGIIRGLWKDLGDRFLSLFGTATDAASSTGSLMARLRKIAESGGTTSGGTSGTTDVTGVETRLGATNEAAAASDTAVSGLNGLLKRLLGKLPALSNGRIPVDSSGMTQPVSSADIGTQSDLAATGDIGSFTLMSAIKRFLARFTIYLSVFGAVADAADTTGTLMARIRATLDRVGSFGDTASTTGSIMAQLRFIGDNQPVAYGDGTSPTAPRGSLLLAKGSGVNAGKVMGLTLDANNMLPVSIPNSINLADFTTPANKLAINASGFIGVSTLPSIIGGVGDAASSIGSLSAQLRLIGESLNRTTIITPISESLSGDRTIIAATAGKAIRITSLYYTVDNSAVITLKSGTTVISGAMAVFDHAGDYPQPLPIAAGAAFVINVSVVAKLRGYVIWYQV